MFLHDDLAATFDTGPGQLAGLDGILLTPAGAMVSAAWDQTPDLETLTPLAGGLPAGEWRPCPL